MICRGKHWSARRVLSDDERTSYEEARRHLLEFNHAPLFLEMVRRNRSEFDQELEYWEANAAHIPQDADGQANLELETNRRLVNYLASVRLFLDNTQTRLSRRYGPTSLELKEFRNQCAHSYDQVFAYRFVYRLRNYSQHCGMPIGKVHVTATAAPEHLNKPRFEVRIEFNVPKLLERGATYWGKVSTELEALPATLDIRPVVHAMSVELERIAQAIRECELPAIRRSAETVNGILSDAIEPGSTPGVAIIERVAPMISMEFLQPPFGLMNSLGYSGFDRPL